ncbi:uncharacterized protein LOC142612108 [Castanea sativa]|uniref:uncharacterized protein LOC142612108 n=1 Tax=Castanea sativa TaxID=21020 RepID=UPI003F64D724
MEEYLNTMPHKVTSEMQEYLSRDYSVDEIKAALFQMGLTKAPELDGMNALFYQKFWHIVGDDVTTAVLDFLNSGLMLPEINYTHIVLIPKIKLPEKISNYRHISLCNVEWDFLRGIMSKLGLLDMWVERVMSCVTTSLSVRIIGKAYGNIRPSRGLIKKRCKLLQRFYRHATSSGQCINFEKSSVYFSSNTTREQRDSIKLNLEVREVDRFDDYLGLPTLVGRSKYQTFSFLRDRLPVKLCNDLNAICARFWWGQMGNERKIHWKNWRVLCQPKREGGMGFRDIRLFNLAMLAKQGLRLLQEKDSLLYGCFKVKYFPRCNFLEARDVPNSSYAWKSLIAAQPILKKGCCWSMGDGSSILVWQDKWIPNFPTNMILHMSSEVDKELRVSDLIDYSIVWLPKKDGGYSVRSGYFTARKVQKEMTRFEECSKSIKNNMIWSRLWKLRIPNKTKIFGWRASQDILPTRENLTKHQLLKDDTCQLFMRESKSMLHALWSCAVAGDVWARSQTPLQKSRNTIIHGGALQDPNRLVQQAVDLLEEGQVQLAIPSWTEIVQTWTPPASCHYKINFDATVFDDIKASGFRVVI